MVGIDDAICGILESKSPGSVALSSIFGELKKQKIIGKKASKKTTNQALARLTGINKIRKDDSSGHPVYRLNARDERTSWDEINDLCKKYQGSIGHQIAVVPLLHGDRYVCDITSTWPARDSGRPVTVTEANRPARRADDARVYAAHIILLRIHQTARIKKDLRREAGQLYTLAMDRGTQYVINNKYPFEESTFREFKGAKNVPAVWNSKAARKAAIDNANFFAYAVNSYIKKIAEEGHEAADLAFERIELVLGIKDGSCIMHGIAQVKFDMDKQQELIREFEEELCLAVAAHLSKRTKPAVAWGDYLEVKNQRLGVDDKGQLRFLTRVFIDRTKIEPFCTRQADKRDRYISFYLKESKGEVVKYRNGPRADANIDDTSMSELNWRHGGYFWLLAIAAPTACITAWFLLKSRVL